MSATSPVEYLGLRVIHQTVASNVERFAPEGIATRRPENEKGK